MKFNRLGLVLFLLPILFGHFANGQNMTPALKKIKTLEQAEEFIQKTPSANAEILILNSNADSLGAKNPLFGKHEQDIVLIDGYTYKILASHLSESFRASYIYLDGSKLTMPEIDSLRNLILTKLRTGTPFPDLVKSYNMDNNKEEGDLGWFDEGMMVKPFEEAVKIHQKGEAFTVDVPENKWYYVVLKTFDNRASKTITVLQTKK